MRTIALLALAIAGVGAFQGCASDSNTSYKGSNPQPEAGACNIAFCNTSSFGPACCINGHCGVMLNGGCVDLGRQDGG
jgi:hypothetical protein